MSLPHDVQAFLDGYPEDSDSESAHDTDTALSESLNLEFYTGARRCQPDNLLIDEIHNQYVRFLYLNVFVLLFIPPPLFFSRGIVQVVRRLRQARVQAWVHSVAVGRSPRSPILPPPPPTHSRV
jgi:hypothetical protein